MLSKLFNATEGLQEIGTSLQMLKGTYFGIEEVAGEHRAIQMTGLVKTRIGKFGSMAKARCEMMDFMNEHFNN